MSHNSFSFLLMFRPISFFLLRLGLGVAFIIHGVSKLPLPPEKLMNYFGFSAMLASTVALSEIFSGLILIVAMFFKNKFGDMATRFSSLVIIIIMTCAFYFAHQDWFFNTKLFTSEQIFLFLIGIFFFINGNKV